MQEALKHLDAALDCVEGFTDACDDIKKAKRTIKKQLSADAENDEQVSEGESTADSDAGESVDENDGQDPAPTQDGEASDENDDPAPTDAEPVNGEALASELSETSADEATDQL